MKKGYGSVILKLNISLYWCLVSAHVTTDLVPLPTRLSLGHCGQFPRAGGLQAKSASSLRFVVMAERHLWLHLLTDPFRLETQP